MMLKVDQVQDPQLLLNLKNFCAAESVIKIANLITDESSQNKDENFELLIQIINCEYFEEASSVLGNLI